MIHIKHPYTRLRRTRNKNWSRDLIAENNIKISNLIQPYFISEGINIKDPIQTMPGVYRLSIDNLLKEIKNAVNIGIKVFMIFPCIEQNKKSYNAKEAYNSNNLMCRAIKNIKDKFSDIGIIGDVALDPYTLDGHDGITCVEGNVLNDKTVDILCKQSLVLAEAGFDILAPSDMMDGRIGKIRETLESNHFYDVQICSYSVKYASCLYGPFRDAIGSKIKLKIDKSSYQMDIRNSNESLNEISLDISEGADSIIIKPGIFYLDIIEKARKKHNIPIFSYQVSGEYSMIKMAAENQVFDFKDAMIESFIALKRAGASGIISYAAVEVAKHINS
ncbi:MAG: porphobilinogen synthase [Candidatus Midichloriaceae bacterium]|jgi:porphobilinogen synthase